MCEVFAQAGARVAFTFRDNQSAADEVAARLGPEARGYRVDVLDTRATTRMCDELEERWGGLDALVNNAGVSGNVPLAFVDEAEWDRVMDINVKGTFLTTRTAVRGMIRRRSGVILNIGSVAGVRMVAAPIHYCASKAAIRGLTEALAKELACYSIRVNCLAPGLLDGGISDQLSAGRRAEYVRHTALGRVATFTEVAHLASFLISDANTYMSGETVVIDGGL